MPDAALTRSMPSLPAELGGRADISRQSQSLPEGWWLFPAAMIGLGFWVGVALLAVRLSS